MNEKIDSDLTALYAFLTELELKTHAMKILNYDMQTAAPEGGMALDSAVVSSLSSENFKLLKSHDFILLVNKLYKKKYDSLGEYEKRLVLNLYRDQEKNRALSPALQKEQSELFSNAYITWIKAKNENSYPLFKDTFEKIADMEIRVMQLRDNPDQKDLYSLRFDDYEENFTSEDLDIFFDELEKGLKPLLDRVRCSNYRPKTEFLSKLVPISKQEEITRFLLEFNGFDFKRGSVSTTEHPFTEQFSLNDVRITTKYFENNFISNMYSVIHEGGHALFGQNIPEEVFSEHLGEGSLSMAKHESVSRFYENLIGRSKAYIHAIYPHLKKILGKEILDVSEKQLYEAVNAVDLNNPIRTEADELTYSFHIMIRYRLEKEMLSGKCDFEHLDQRWNELYEELLGVENSDAKTGILQDVHWTEGFGYFPTYALGNALGCMYLEKMKENFDVEKEVSEGNMKILLDWLKKNVFKTAALLDTKTWIKKITGKKFTAKPYIDYLTEKYTQIYHLDAKVNQQAYEKYLKKGLAKQVIEKRNEIKNEYAKNNANDRRI